MVNLTLEDLTNNIIEDLSVATEKQICSIYEELKVCLKKFDRDSTLKDISDYFKKMFKSKEERCVLIVNDIIDSKDKLTEEELVQLKKCFSKISLIYRTFGEDVLKFLSCAA